MSSDDFKLANKVRLNRHKKRKNNDIVAAMYAMYCLPSSLEQIAKVYRKTRQAVYDVFRTRGYPLRSKQLKGQQFLDGISFTLTKGNHLRGTVGKRRIMMHQYVWEKERGICPPDHCIYHIDRNPQNNSIDNLAILPKNQMSKTFNPKGHNQHTKHENQKI